MRVLVCGGRDYDDADRVEESLDALNPTLVIQGGCPTGADLHARRWTKRTAVTLLTYHADWRQGRKAGPLRNQRMLDESAPDTVLAFPGGRGTADMVRRARAAGVHVTTVSDRERQ